MEAQLISKSKQINRANANADFTKSQTQRKEIFSNNKTNFIQAKLTVNKPGDAYEQEADRVADQVVGMNPANIQTKQLSISALQRTTMGGGLEEKDKDLRRKATGEEEKEKELHRKAMGGGLEEKEKELHRKSIGEEEKEKELHRKEMNADNHLENYVGNLNSGGQSLPDDVRSFYEPRFGYDFSIVKVHTDSVAAKSAQSVNALAYTSGNNIVFNQGQYAPQTDNGKKLLAHELTHVVQQSNGTSDTVKRSIQRRLIVSGSNEANVNEYLNLVGGAAGVRLNWAFAQPRVTVGGNLPGGAASASARTNLLSVINHPRQNAEIHVGTNQPRVAVGAFPTAPSHIQTIDMDDIRNINASLPGQGTAKAFHEMMENFTAHGAAGFANFPASHAVGLRSESDILEDLGIAGRRLSGGVPATVIPAPAGQPTGPNITYLRRLQIFTDYTLEIIQRRTLGSPTGPGPDFEVVSARRIPKVQVSQRTIDSFASGGNAIPAAGNATLNNVLADLNANPNSTVLIEGFADSVGGQQGNRRLSENRANTAQAFFLANGITADRIAIVGRGETNFVATNATEAGRAQNRRIVLTVNR